MPKRKRVSSAHLARQAKKRKRDNESRKETQPLEDNFVLTTLKDGNKKGNMMQQVIHKLAQQNLDRRLDEQQRDTIGSKVK